MLKKGIKYSVVGLLLVMFSCKKGPCYKQHKKLDNATEVYGLDVSHHQGKINWEDLKNDGLVYVYIKASQSTHYKDPKFKVNRLEAGENCIHNGAYHFYVTGKDPVKQAENFIAAVDSLKGNLPPVLDLEEMSIEKKVSVETFQKNVLKWLNTVEDKFDVTPIIYTDPSFANKYLNSTEFKKYDLWLAEYTNAKQPKLPDTWKEKGYAFWQRSDTKKEQGVRGKIDYDVFDGNGKDLRKLLVD